MVEQAFMIKTKTLIDDLKSICSDFWLWNSGDEFRIITQVFLYKFMNDKFWYEVKQIDVRLRESNNWEEEISKYSESEYENLIFDISADSAKMRPDHFISTLYNKQNIEQFSLLFSDTLRDIAKLNSEVFSVKTEEWAKIQLFYWIDGYVKNFSEKQKDNFSRAIINQLVEVNFEEIFDQKFDFFSTIFEYLIKDYNKDWGWVYAEYYTPHAIARIMASILVDKPVNNVTAYDPSAGSGTLLMNVAHAIWEDKCTIYSQDLSDKSSNLLRLNLILNNLVHSINNIIQWNTIKDPYHKEWNNLMKFDYIVSNPPFKLDFSKWRDELDTKENKDRFFAGIPKIKPKDKKKMEIYVLFMQHIMHSLSEKWKAAIVVPTWFITAPNGIEKKIREELIKRKMLKWVVSMPSNIFATTGTNVSVIFLDKQNKDGKVVLMDASKLWTPIKDWNNQKTVLSPEEETKIIWAFNDTKEIEDLSIIVDYAQIKEKNYSFSAWQYFPIKTLYNDITVEQFKEKMDEYESNLWDLFIESKKLEEDVFSNISKLRYDN